MAKLSQSALQDRGENGHKSKTAVRFFAQLSSGGRERPQPPRALPAAPGPGADSPTPARFRRPGRSPQPLLALLRAELVEAPRLLLAQEGLVVVLEARRVLVLLRGAGPRPLLPRRRFAQPARQRQQRQRQQQQRRRASPRPAAHTPRPPRAPRPAASTAPRPAAAHRVRPRSSPAVPPLAIGQRPPASAARPGGATSAGRCGRSGGARGGPAVSRPLAGAARGRGRGGGSAPLGFLPGRLHACACLTASAESSKFVVAFTLGKRSVVAAERRPSERVALKISRVPFSCFEAKSSPRELGETNWRSQSAFSACSLDRRTSQHKAAAHLNVKAPLLAVSQSARSGHPMCSAYGSCCTPSIGLERTKIGYFAF